MPVFFDFCDMLGETPSTPEKTMRPSRDVIHTANREIQAFLEHFLTPDGGTPAGLPSPAQVATLAEQLRQVGAFINDREGSLGRLSGSGEEFSEYVTNLVRLQDLLLRLQPTLLAQRARLLSDRQHLIAARAWATTLRNTR